MSDNTGNGVMLASGKGKGARGVATALKMISETENGSNVAPVLRRVMSGFWTKLLERDWACEFKCTDRYAFFTTHLKIGNSFELIIKAQSDRNSAYYEIVTLHCDYPARDEPWSYRSMGSDDEDVKILTTTIGVLMATLGRSVLDNEPPCDPFTVGGESL